MSKNSRKQKRAQRMRGKNHEKATRPERPSFHTDDPIKHGQESKVGQQLISAQHKDTPAGQRTVRQLVKARFHEIGVHHPTRKQLDDAVLIALENGARDETNIVQEPAKVVLELTAVNKAQEQFDHASEVVKGMGVTAVTGGSFTVSHIAGTSDPIPYGADPSIAQAAFEQAVERDVALIPDLEEWDFLVTSAKKKKRGLERYADSQGYYMIGGDNDPKYRLSWRRKTDVTHPTQEGTT